MDATELVFLLTPIDSYNLQLSIYRDSITAYQLIIIQKKKDNSTQKYKNCYYKIRKLSKTKTMLNNV